MTSPTDRHAPASPEPSPEDARFVERLAAAWTPPALDPVRRSRFDARLADRIARGSERTVRWLSVTAAAVAAALLFFLTWEGVGPAPQPTGEVATTSQAIEGSARVADEYVVVEAVAPFPKFEASLPKDYQAIASLIAGE
jgi:hypothetical protein